MADLRIGHGFDVHRLVEGRKLILGGVEVPFEKGLEGHSDADVIVHAIIDALLGAAGMGDIGQHFPPSDQQYKDADSLDLLRKVLDKLDISGFGQILNVDVTVMCDAPKLGPHFPGMRERLATVLTFEDVTRINLKATTTEGLGFTGRGEGIAASAICLIERNA
jgi:2-C-methyl-D-erythritol 2,4-cyclodiphosphate synthase